jgi:endonuclease/exonuclease/phosphatase family metal-dependent hydrolase
MFKKVILYAFIALLSQASMAAGSKEIRVLAYNIKGLPGIAGGYNKSRFTEIGKMLLERRKNGTAPDFVLLQESFMKNTQPVRDIAQYPHIVKGPNDENEFDENGKKFSKIFNAGLYIMSNHPLSDANKMIFGKPCNSWDCRSNKGLQSVVADVPGLPFKLIIANTHMQAGGKNDVNRMKQMDTANRFIRKFASTGPMIFAGDFNTVPNLPSYPYWFQTSELKSAGEYCLNPNQTDCIVKPGTDIDWVVQLTKDHHFYREGVAETAEGDVQVTITPLTVERNFTEIHEDKPLSDHMGYEVLYRISWK